MCIEDTLGLASLVPLCLCQELQLLKQTTNQTFDSEKRKKIDEEEFEQHLNATR